MVGLKEICALLVAGSMGAGSVVAVQQAKPPQARVKAKPKAPNKARPAPRTVAQAPALDCPSVSSLGGQLAELAPIVPMEAAPTASLVQPGQLATVGGGESGLPLPPIVGGGSGGPSVPGFPVGPETPVSSIPEPMSWAMMLSGFGLVGLAFRRRPGDTARRKNGTTS